MAEGTTEQTLDDQIGQVIDSTVPKAEPETEPQDAPEEEAKPETAPETKPEPEKEAPAEEKPAEEAPDPDLASEMADASHEAVRKTAPFKGLLSETQRLRAENKQLAEQLVAANAAKAKPAEPEEAAESDTDEAATDLPDDDADVFTAKDVKKIVAAAVAPLKKELEATRQAIDGTTKAARAQSFQKGLDALRAEQAAGNIPANVNTDKLIREAMSVLRESKPAVLADLLSDPDPVRAVWQYATTRLPAAVEQVSKAAKEQTEVESERLAKGRSPTTGKRPSPIHEMFDALQT